MSNFIYAIPLKILVNYKDDPKSMAFISESDVNLNEPCKYPNIGDIKNAIKNAKLEMNSEHYKNYSGKEGWHCGIKEPDGYHSYIEIDNVTTDTANIKSIISFPSCYWETAVKFLFELEKIIGPILFYCDAGTMTMITKEKTIDDVLKEM